MESVADIMYPHKKKFYEETGKSIERNLESKAANFKFYALEIDESTDATDMAHLAIFTRGTDNKHNITVEMASLVSLKDTSKSLYLFDAAKKTS